MISRLHRVKRASPKMALFETRQATPNMSCFGGQTGRGWPTVKTALGPTESKVDWVPFVPRWPIAKC